MQTKPTELKNIESITVVDETKNELCGSFRTFSSSEEMWNVFLEYKTWCELNPIFIEDYVGKDAIRVDRKKPRPLTIEGFENFVMRKGWCIADFDYLKSPEETDVLEQVIRRVRSEIRQNQLEGGMVGIFSGNIVSRLNRLAENVDTRVTVEQPLFLDDEETEENK